MRSNPAHEVGVRRLNVMAWVASGLVASVLTLTGSMKFFAYDMEVTAFARWGYPSWFVLVVGMGELVVAGTVLWRRTAFYGAVLGVVLMAGAIVTHLRVPEVGLIPLALIAAALCGFIAWSRRGDRWQPKAK